jgi:hypothetical protein
MCEFFSEFLVNFISLCTICAQKAHVRSIRSQNHYSMHKKFL